MEFLRGQGAKAVVVARNTRRNSRRCVARSLRSAHRRDRASRQARRCSDAIRSGRRARDDADAGGRKFAKLVRTHAGKVEVLTQAAPGLVDQVEAGQLAASSTRSLVEQ